MLGEPAPARRTEALAQRIRGEHFVQLGSELAQHHVREARADDRRDEACRDVEADVVDGTSRTERLADRAYRKHVTVIPANP